MTTFYDQQPRHTSLRHSCHDYSSTASYFVTILTRQREHFLGKIIDHKMVLSDMGQIVFEQWYKLPEYFPDIELDEFVVMPNHLHGIIVKPLLTRETLNSTSAIEKTREHLSKIIGLYKAGCTRIINSMQNEYLFGWHRNYYDHVIRNAYSLNKIRKYIQLNPSRWDEDENNI